MVFKDVWNFTPTWIWHKYWGVMVYTSWLLIDWEKPFGLYHKPLLPTDRHSSGREKGLFYDYRKWREYDREYVGHNIAGLVLVTDIDQEIELCSYEDYKSSMKKRPYKLIRVRMREDMSAFLIMRRPDPEWFETLDETGNDDAINVHALHTFTLPNGGQAADVRNMSRRLVRWYPAQARLHMDRPVSTTQWVPMRTFATTRDHYHERWGKDEAERGGDNNGKSTVDETESPIRPLHNRFWENWIGFNNPPQAAAFFEADLLRIYQIKKFWCILVHNVYGLLDRDSVSFVLRYMSWAHHHQYVFAVAHFKSNGRDEEYLFHLNPFTTGLKADHRDHSEFRKNTESWDVVLRCSLIPTHIIGIEELCALKRDISDEQFLVDYKDVIETARRYHATKLGNAYEDPFTQGRWPAAIEYNDDAQKVLCGYFARLERVHEVLGTRIISEELDRRSSLWNLE